MALLNILEEPLPVLPSDHVVVEAYHVPVSESNVEQSEERIIGTNGHNQYRRNDTKELFNGGTPPDCLRLIYSFLRFF